MPAYPIEVLNFGAPSFTAHQLVVERLNSLQSEFRYLLPSRGFEHWSDRFARQEYTTQYVWQRLREYRKSAGGFHPFIIAIIHTQLSSQKIRNLFGSIEETEGLAVFTTQDWDERYAPPPIEVFLIYFFIRYTISFISPTLRNHDDTRSCFLDKKWHKPDIKASLFSGKLCGSCSSLFEDEVGVDTYGALTAVIDYMKQVANDPNLLKADSLERPKPHVFIGSSSEGLRIAQILQMGLDQSTESDLWTQGVFGLSEGTLDSLVKAAHKYEYAVLVLTPDDLTTKRDQTQNSPRDNVLFELGLFMGALGRDRTFMVYCRDDPLELPSDLASVTAATFRRRANDNLAGALGPVVTQLEQAMKLF